MAASKPSEATGVDNRFINTIEWGRPWLAPLRSMGERLQQTTDWRSEASTIAAALGLHNHAGLPLRFVPQAELPAGLAYESFISTTGCVPTRDNLHDFFNALVWLTFPCIKRQLNALQAAEISRLAGQEIVGRGRVRDAVTIFDENAAILVVRDARWIDALRAHHWQEVFLTQREDFYRNCQVLLFGHALTEKLVTPYKAITGHGWPVLADGEFFSMSNQEQSRWIDLRLAQQLSAGISNAMFTPIPVLGVPGWCDGQDEAFYADTKVFRPKRSKKQMDE